MKCLVTALTLFLALSLSGPAFADSCRINLDVEDNNCGCIVRDPDYQDRPFNQVHLCKAVLERTTAKGTGHSGGKISHSLAKRLFSYLSVGLIAGVIELASENGYPILFAVMEPFLIRNLRKLGIDFPFMDAPVEYHGLRVPCALLSLHDACAAMKQKDRAAWEIVTNKGRTQELALIAQTKSERARRAVARAFRLAKRPAPVVLSMPGAQAKMRRPLRQVDPIVKRLA